MKKYALKNISQIKFIDGNVEIKYADGTIFKLKENCVFDVGVESHGTLYHNPFASKNAAILLDKAKTKASAR